jgi:hypothetical protein
MSIDITGAQWFKSSRSQSADECVEVAWLDTGHIGIRDSKNPDDPALIFAPREWDSFTLGVTDGEFDCPA